MSCWKTSLLLLAVFYHSSIDAQIEDDYRIVWNAPTDACAKYGVDFSSVLKSAGIEVNTGGSFRGDVVSILYDPGSFPAIVDGEPRDGGVPQEGLLPQHLAALAADIQRTIPDKDFDGLGVLDFEKWRPIWRENWGALDQYRKYSKHLEAKRHPFWTSDMIERTARARFERAAYGFMADSLSEARRLRPKASWGFYGFPKCFNFTPNNNRMQCDDKVREDNDRSEWMVKEGTGLYPSVYLPYKDLSEAKRAKMIQGKVVEAKRVAAPHGLPVFPYVSYKYQDNKAFLAQADMKSSLLVPKRFGAAGVVVWGASHDASTEAKCLQLYTYVKDIISPLAKQIKKMRLVQQEEMDSSFFNSIPLIL